MELSEEQRGSLALFREVTADARDEASSIEVLKSCNWNVEQALSLHLASHDEDTGPPPGAGRPAAGPSSVNPLSAPLLPGHGRSSAATHGSAGAESPGSMAYGLFSRLAQGIKQIGFSVLSLVYTFFFGTGGGALGTSGAAFRRSLQSSYGTQALPEFHDGSFSQAVTRARQDLKLLVVYLHSEHARHSQSVCSDVLGNDVIRAVLDENFILWGGDVARMEAHQVSRMIHARQFPSFCVLLPASVEEIRVIGALHGQIEAEAAQALLAACMEEMETHRAEIVAQQVQRVEDRFLREQQDREYQEALEMDRRRAEERDAQRRREEEERQQAEEIQRKAQEELERQQQVQRELEVKRRALAGQVPTTAPASATARLALRLPSGQRVDRKFEPTAKLQEVYDWASCVAYLPENLDKGIDIPERFVLKTSFPVHELIEMERTVEELKLSGTNILLAAIEDDD